MSASRQRLVLVCQLFYPESVSTGQTLTELAEELSARGLEITVITSQPTVIPGSKRVPAWMEHGGVFIRRTWSTRFRKTSFPGKLCNLTTFFLSAAWEVMWRQRDAQLLLLTNPPYLPLLGWFCHIVRRQTFGVVLFDIMPRQAELLGFLKSGGTTARIWRRLNRAWYRRASYVVALSGDMREGALQNANLLATPDEAAGRAKTHIIHVWSDDRLIEPMPKGSSAEAQRLGVANRFVVQYSGNHGRFHDLETLLGIVKSLAQDERFMFQFIGEGQKKDLVTRYIAAERPQGVYSSSYTPKEFLSHSLAMADLGVVAQMPGQESVCYPSKLLGIMAAGRAILAICPPDCEMARMITQQGLGYVVRNGDIDSGRRILMRAVDSPGEVAEMGTRAAKCLRENWTLARAADAYFKLIQGRLGRT